MQNQFSENRLAAASEDVIHIAAIRTTAILFINHMWSITRERIGLDVMPFYRNIAPNNEFYLNAWNMVDQ